MTKPDAPKTPKKARTYLRLVVHNTGPLQGRDAHGRFTRLTTETLFTLN